MKQNKSSTQGLQLKGILSLAAVLLPVALLSSCMIRDKLSFLPEDLLPSRTFDKIPKPKPIITKDLQKQKPTKTLPDIELKQAPEDFFQDEVRLLWPLKGKVIGRFRELDEGEKPSLGIHILSTPQSPVRSGLDGVVTYSGPHKKFLNVVVVSKDKLKVAYGYLEGALPPIRSKVSAGQIIGVLSGKDGKPILYMAVQSGSSPVNPLEYLD